MPHPRRTTSPPPPATKDTILLAVTGDSPAILTETVWALAQENPPIIPKSVVVITTTRGAKRLRDDLLSGGKATVWTRLRATLREQHAFPATSLTLEDPRILTLPDPATGTALQLEDVRSPLHNEAAADFILDEVRRITANGDTRLVASIAGGRKTMGALLYAAMTLLGREGDRITHVLVNDPFDLRLDPPFHFPTTPPTRHRLTSRDGNMIEHDSADARIDLADVPFVPLRNAFAEVRDHVGTFRKLVERYSKSLGDLKPELGFRYGDSPALLINGRAVDLENDRQVLILEFIARTQPHRPAGIALTRQRACLLLQAWAHRAFARGGDDSLKSATNEDKRALQDMLAALPSNLKISAAKSVITGSALADQDVSRALSAVRTAAKVHGSSWMPARGSLTLPPHRLSP